MKREYSYFPCPPPFLCPPKAIPYIPSQCGAGAEKGLEAQCRETRPDIWLGGHRGLGGDTPAEEIVAVGSEF